MVIRRKSPEMSTEAGNLQGGHGASEGCAGRDCRHSSFRAEWEAEKVQQDGQEMASYPSRSPVKVVMVCDSNFSQGCRKISSKTNLGYR